MFEKVLFATDFSDYAKKTLECIAGFPGIREVLLLHIIEEARSPRGGGKINNLLFQNASNFLKEERHILEALGKNLRVSTELKAASDTAGAILETADEKGISLIVVGARGNSLVEGILLGSVSRSILHRSKVSVLIMRHRIVEDLKGRTYELFCPRILSNVLCPVDFSQYSDNAISLASSTAGIGQIILVNIVSHGETKNEIEEALRAAKDQMNIIRNNIAKKGKKVRSIVGMGNPASEITRIADEENASIIWISSRGKGWFRELLLGSTACSVAMNAKQPVLIIRTRHAEDNRSREEDQIPKSTDIDPWRTVKSGVELLKP